MRKNAVMILAWLAAGAAFGGAADRQVFLRVNPVAGETKTQKSGGHGRGILGLSSLKNNNTTKSITRNMCWNCELRFRGRPRPEKTELKVFYIGYEGKDMKPKILGREIKPVVFDESGKAQVELKSPTVTQTKSKTSGGGTGNGRIAKTKSMVKGQRIEGCVVQLWIDGKLLKSHATQSGWERAAKNEAFSEALLSSSNRL